MLKKYTPKNKPLKDITGQKFRNLLVLRMEKTKKFPNGGFRAICKCLLCGRENYEIAVKWLKQSHTGSCGCDKTWTEKHIGKNSKKFKGYEGLYNYYLENARKRANKKGWKFDIDLVFLWDLFLKQERKCALSGQIIFFTKNTIRSQGTASLDRINSRAGYTKDNVQWVHKDVNAMKLDTNENKFISICKLIVENNETMIPS